MDTPSVGEQGPTLPSPTRAESTALPGAPAQPAPAALRRVLGVVDFFTLAFGSIVGVGWVVVMHDWLGRGGPVGALVGFLAGGLLLVPIGLVYGRLTARLPLSDGDMAFTAALVPSWARFRLG